MSLSMFVLLPVFVRTLGGSDTTAGLVLGLGAAASVACRPLVGVLMDRVGRRSTLLLGTGVNVLSFVPFFWIDRIGPALFAAGVLHCVVWGYLFAAFFTYAADLAPASRRAEGIAMFGVFGILTNGLGPSLAEAVIGGVGHAAWIATMIAFATTCFALTFGVPRDAGRVHVGGGSAFASMAALLRRGGGPLRVFVVLALFGTGINAAFYFVALFVRALELPRAAPFFVAYSATSVVLRLLGRRLPDRLGPRRVAVPFFAIFAAGLGALTLLPAPGVLVLAGMACGAGHGALWPVLQSLALDRAPAAAAGAVVALSTAALDLGAVLGTPLCGWIADVAGYRPMFATMSGLALVALLLMLGDG